MLKFKSKLFVVFVALMLLVSTICFATDAQNVSTVPGDNARTGEPVPTSGTNEVTTNETGDTTTSGDSNDHTHEDLADQILNDDLYMFDNNVVMDKLVDGNAYLFGNNVEVSGRVNGNLYVFGNTITFKSGSYVVNSIFIAGRQVDLDTQANDIYIAGDTVNISYDTFIVRDLRVGANNLNFNGCVGRNAFIDANNFDFIKNGEQSALVYGNLDYTSTNKLELSSEDVQGNINYKEPVVYDEDSIQDIIFDKINSLLASLLFTIVVYLLALWIAPNFMKKSASFVSTKAIPAIGIGFLTLILIPVACFILLCSTVGVSASFALLGLYILILLICSSIVSICITNKIKEQYKFDKKSKVALTLVITAIVLWALQQIPFIGGWIGFLLAIIGLGVMFMYLFTKNKKDNNNSTEAVA